MGFKISGLPFERVEHLMRLDAFAREAAGVVELRVDEEHAYPCRVTLEDAVPGEAVLLFNFPHQPADSPYQASGPIFVRRAADRTRVAVNEVPDQQRRRLLSVRAYDARDWIVAAEVTPGTELEAVIERLFADPRVAYLHLHNARPGCYAARVDRA
ncbi:MAG TPA: DUF1203 domain-containing protein [Steroidobacteraceae bacterium]|nr:DUF1203 domain-containing protein [Steroidobacteraceae bacterium]